ncbi:MAG: class D beta-lactamase [Proteobacteria bacterium]|nr:class D beta-lactamase [Pseudomonadota bacterium]
MPSVDPFGGRKGCFILYDLGNEEEKRIDSGTCKTPLSPASTFKIPHAIIALEEGVLKDELQIIPYNGEPHYFKIWQQDHSLESAMKYSVVPFFQYTAAQIGEKAMAKWLKRLNYGKRSFTSGITEFWLTGDQRISPDEQAVFLKRFFGDELPIKHSTAEMVRRVLIQPPGSISSAKGEIRIDAEWKEGTVLSCKTGSTDTDGEFINWLVGQIRTGNREFVFVSNVVHKEGYEAGNIAVKVAIEMFQQEELLGRRQ